MKKIYIYGLGKCKKYVDECLKKENALIVGYIDNYKAEEYNVWDEKKLIKQADLDEDYDYIVVSIYAYDSIKNSLLSQGIAERKIICFFDFADADIEEYWSIFDSLKWRTNLMWVFCMNHYMTITMPTIQNLNYEIYYNSESVSAECPKIMSVEDTVNILNKEKKCLARFGDGEFELMNQKKRPNFQDVDSKLSSRLKEVLNSNLDNLMVAIADNYGSLDKYTDNAAINIRHYMRKEVREYHMSMLDKNRQYYDAYLSRPYIIYRDKIGAKRRFENIKKIWDNQDVLIVEGEYTRFGVGNDLLDNASNVLRILAPRKNAFSKYEEIFAAVKEFGKNRLILIILGATATVMAHDLAKEEFWAIDIGQLDVEYEWYLRNVTERCDIPYKCVSEVKQTHDIITDDNESFIKKYKSEVIMRIL